VKILVLGVSGMLGNAVMRTLSHNLDYQVWGSARSASVRTYFSHALADYVVDGIDVGNFDALSKLLAQMQPEVVINCVGLVKQLADSNDPLYALPINALLPHRLSHLCKLANARLVHISTDCVFSGRKGGYRESDEPDALDLYGRSKLLGEVYEPHTITLRTSIIGHELNSANGLIGWFLAQEGRVKGFTKAIFSGLPTCELARVIGDIVLQRADLHGLYHVAAQPISKYELLKLVNTEYGKQLVIDADDRLKIDRSLNAQKFCDATGYKAPKWPLLISQMREFQ
jgi:dTDP-4-dehydrorhamnose reductase